MIRPETSYADISTPQKSEELISLLDEYIDYLERLKLPNGDDVIKQEDVVATLYKFSESIQENEHDCRYGDKTIHLQSVSEAVASILRIFGYTVISIE